MLIKTCKTKLLTVLQTILQKLKGKLNFQNVSFIQKIARTFINIFLITQLLASMFLK